MTALLLLLLAATALLFGLRVLVLTLAPLPLPMAPGGARPDSGSDTSGATASKSRRPGAHMTMLTAQRQRTGEVNQVSTRHQTNGYFWTRCPGKLV